MDKTIFSVSTCSGGRVPAVKKNLFVILIGVAALHIVIFGGLAVGGCKTPVMGDRTFVAAPVDDSAAGETPAPLPVNNTVSQPQQQARPAVPTYQPMEPVKTQPLTDRSTAVTPGAGESSYVVKAGDTASKIANAHGVSLAALRKANNMTMAQANKLRIGQKLVIPAAGKPVVANSGKKSGASTRKTQSESVAPVLGADGTYTVKAGDSPDRIARRFKVKTDDLLKVNNISDPRRLQIGQKLVIPGKGAAPEQTTTNVAAKNAGTQTESPANNAPAPQKDEPTSADLSQALDEAANAPVSATGTGSESSAMQESAAAGGDANAAAANYEVLIIDEDTTVEELAKQYNTTVENLRTFNGSSIPADGKLKASDIIFVPKK